MMQRSGRFRHATFFLVVAWLSITTDSFTQDVSPRFSITVTAVDSTVKSGSPVWVTVRMENYSNRGLPVYRENAADQGGFVYKADIRTQTGTLAPETKFGRRIQDHDTAEERAREPYVTVTSGGEQNLGPGKSIIDRMNISKLYDLTRPGKYTLELQRFDTESKTFVRSNKITVTVIP
jgi:hypothetical protein